MRRVFAAVLLALLVSLLGPMDTAGAEPSALTVSFPRAATVSAGAKPGAVTGTVTGTPGRPVWLQAQTSQGWVTLDDTVTGSLGGYALRTPTWWVAHQVLRTFAPATGVQQRSSQRHDRQPHGQEDLRAARRVPPTATSPAPRGGIPAGPAPTA